MNKLTPDSLRMAINTTLESLQSNSTRLAYGLWLKRFEDWITEVDYLPITYDLIIEYIGSLSEIYQPANRIQALSAIKKLCDTIHKMDRNLIDLYTHTIIQGIKPEKYKAKLAGQMIPDRDIEALFEACKERKPGGKRDAAIIALLHSTGMRRGECAPLTVTDYDLAEEMITLRETKNKQDRLAYLNPGAISHLQAWLALRGMSPGPIFWRTKRNGDLWIDKGISGAAIYNIIHQRCSQAGVEFYTPHDFRRTLISNLLDQVDIALVSKIVGHSSVAMTASYDRRDNEEMKRAIKKIYTPFAR
jgi:integrase